MPTTLPEIVDTAEFSDKVAEPFREAYVEIGGKMRLQRSGSSALETALDRQKEAAKNATLERDTFRTELETEQKRSAEAELTLKKLRADADGKAHGLSGDELDELVAKRAKTQSGEEISTLQGKLVASEERADTAERKALDVVEEQARARLTEKLKEHALAEGYWSNATDEVARHVRGAGFNTLSKAGDPIALDSDGDAIPSVVQKGPLTLEEVYASLDERRSYLRPAKSGTGSQQSAGKPAAGGSKLLKDMSDTERAKRISDIGLPAYEQEVKSQGYVHAGSTVGAAAAN